MPLTRTTCLAEVDIDVLTLRFFFLTDEKPLISVSVKYSSTDEPWLIKSDLRVIYSGTDGI